MYIEQNAIASTSSSTSEVQNNVVVLPQSKETIVLEDESGVIVGQMVKISGEVDQMKEIRMAASAKEERKTLLSIVGKY